MEFVQVGLKVTNRAGSRLSYLCCRGGGLFDEAAGRDVESSLQRSKQAAGIRGLRKAVAKAPHPFVSALSPLTQRHHHST